MKSDSQSSFVCGCDAHVLAIEPICREHARIELSLDRFPPSVAGQFVQILCHEPEERVPRTFDWPEDGDPKWHASPDWAEGAAYLRRPFSIGDRWEDERGRTHLVIISRNVGSGTAWLEQHGVNDSINITGPLGRGFRIPDDDRRLILIGGGVGIPPLLYLARALQEAGKRDAILIFGALRGELLPVRLTDEPARDGSPRLCVDAGAASGYPASVTTDDGSRGLRGVVTDALRMIAKQDAGGSAGRATVFACGPEKMLKAIAAMTRELNWDCQLCIERRMGCGLGTCLSCIVRVHAPGQESGWRWALTCQDGPVFDRDELLD